MLSIAIKRKNSEQDLPIKKRKPSFITVPMKKLFSKDYSPGKGRPPLSDEVIDVLADLQTKAHVSANQAGEISGGLNPSFYHNKYFRSKVPFDLW